MKPTQRDWMEMFKSFEPIIQTSKSNLRNPFCKSSSNQSIETDRKIKGKNKFRSHPRKPFRYFVEKNQRKGKKKKKKNGKDCPRKLRRARARARSAPTRLSIRPCGGETMTILLHSDAGLLAGETMAPADMQPAKTDMSVQRTRRLAWDFVFSSLRQATHPGRGSNF